jgi:hypothetical protein
MCYFVRFFVVLVTVFRGSPDDVFSSAEPKGPKEQEVPKGQEGPEAPLSGSAGGAAVAKKIARKKGHVPKNVKLVQTNNHSLGYSGKNGDLDPVAGKKANKAADEKARLDKAAQKAVNRAEDERGRLAKIVRRDANIAVDEKARLESVAANKDAGAKEPAAGGVVYPCTCVLGSRCRCFRICVRGFDCNCTCGHSTCLGRPRSSPLTGFLAMSREEKRVQLAEALLRRVGIII